MYDDLFNCILKAIFYLISHIMNNVASSHDIRSIQNLANCERELQNPCKFRQNRLLSDL